MPVTNHPDRGPFLPAGDGLDVWETAETTGGGAVAIALGLAGLLGIAVGVGGTLLQAVLG